MTFASPAWLEALVAANACACFGVPRRELRWELGLVPRGEPVPGTGGLPELTSRESDILRSLACGHSIRQTARALGIPSSTTFDYEWAWLQHELGCRAATRVVVPESIPP